MRLEWLTKRQKFEGTAEEAQSKVIAVIMDWPLDANVVTVLASSEGDASVYTTGTFGMIGGIGHATVRKAAIAFVESAQKVLSLSSPTADYSYPGRQEIRFFFVTPAAVRVVSFASSDVQKENTPAAELYAQGQRVLTELRLVTERQRGY
jgi:hypothetical protein